MMITVCPRSISAFKAFIKVFMSWKCRPVVGSSKTKMVGVAFSEAKIDANLTRWLSPPESVLLLCPNLM